MNIARKQIHKREPIFCKIKHYNISVHPYTLSFLKDMNHNLVGDIHQVTHQDAEPSTVSEQILAFCTKTKSKKELAAFCGFKDLRNFTLKHINPLLESGQLEMTIPDKPKSRNRKYITVHSE